MSIRLRCEDHCHPLPAADQMHKDMENMKIYGTVEKFYGTVKKAKPFSAEEDAKVLRKAMKGLGNTTAHTGQ